MDPICEARFPVVSRYPRPAEPVSIPLPLAAGRIPDGHRLHLLDGNRPVPSQVQVTSRWPDGSPRWVILHALVDLPGLREKSFTIAALPGPDPRWETEVTALPEGQTVAIDTGVLQFGLPLAGGAFRLDTLFAHGHGSPLEILALEVETSAGKFVATGGTWRLPANENGPIRCVAEGTGTLTGDGPALGYRARLIAWAGRTELDLEVTLIQNTDEAIVSLERVMLPLRPAAPREVRQWLGKANYRTSIEEVPAGQRGRMQVDATEIMFTSNEQTSEVFDSDFFADWTPAAGVGVTATVYQASQQFPKALSIGPDGIEIDLLPRLPGGTGPIEFRQGMAKTHRVQVRWHPAEEDREAVGHRSLQYQLPDQAVLPREAYLAAGVFAEKVFPVKIHQRLESHATSLADDRARAYGWLHWGDGPDAGYTDQGRGRGAFVWTNNEYDLPHVGFLHYVNTGERRFRAMAEVAARHWLDVDIVHHHDDVHRIGGHVAHSAHHVTGGLSPCHEWVEGLLDFTHFTGRPEGLEAAKGIARHVLHVLATNRSLHEPGASAARVTGWALRTLVAMYRETNDELYLQPARDIVDNFVAWHDSFGGFLAPYHSHTLARVPFMISIACGSLYRYHQVFADPRIEKLVVGEMRSLIETCRRPDGRWIYKDLPSLHRRGAGFYVLEALSYAYDLSGDRTFLKAGVSELLHALEHAGQNKVVSKSKTNVPEEQAVLFGSGAGPKEYAAQWLPLMVFYRALAEAEMLPPDWLDYLDGR